MIVEIVDRILDGLDLLRVLIGHLNAELLFDSDDQVNHLERICSQASFFFGSDELRLRNNFFEGNPELIRDDRPQTVLFRISHHTLPTVKLSHTLFTSVSRSITARRSGNNSSQA